MQTSDFVHDETNQQFRLQIEGKTAWVDYSIRDGRYFLVHSEVPAELRGRGAGRQLVERTFEYLEAKQQPAVAVCSYVKAVARRSPKWRGVIGGL